MGALADKYRAKPSLAAKYRVAPADATDPLPTPEGDALDALKPDRPLGALGAGIQQGASLGFSDELTGAVDTVAEGIGRNLERIGLKDAPTVDIDPSLNPNTPAISKSWGPAQPAGSAPEVAERVPEREGLSAVYRRVRDRDRGASKAAEAAHPALYAGGELVGGLAVPIPGGGLAKGASLTQKMGQGAKVAAGMGAALGAGKSEADSAGGVLGDAALNAAVAAPLGAASGAAAHGFGKLAERFGGKAATLRAADDARIAEAVEKERRSLLGTARSATQSASRDIEVLARPGDPRSLPVQAKVNQFVDGAEARELADAIALSKLDSAPERIAEMKGARGAHDAFAEKMPDEIAKRIAGREAKGIRSEALPRAKVYATRVLPPIIGSAVGSMVSDDKATGGLIGAGVGAGVAASLGAPGTAFANMMKSPAFRIAFAEMQQGGSNALSHALGRFAPVVAAQTSEAGIAAALKKVAEADPEAAAKALAALEQSKPKTLAERFSR